MNRIKEARIAARLSQKYVASSLGVAGPSVSNWESGKSKPTHENLIQLAELFNVSTDYLLGLNTTETTSAASPSQIPPSADFTDPDVMAMMTRNVGKMDANSATIYLSILDKIRKLDEEKLAQAEAFVTFLESQAQK